MAQAKRDTGRISTNLEVLAERLPAGETVFLHQGKEEFFGLDPVGTRVWDLLAEGQREDEVCRQLLEEYDVEPDRLRLDVYALIEDLLAHDFVTRHDV